MDNFNIQKNFDYNQDAASATYEKYGITNNSDDLYLKKTSDFSTVFKPSLIDKSLEFRNKTIKQSRNISEKNNTEIKDKK